METKKKDATVKAKAQVEPGKFDVIDQIALNVALRLADEETRLITDSDVEQALTDSATHYKLGGRWEECVSGRGTHRLVSTRARMLARAAYDIAEALCEESERRHYLHGVSQCGEVAK